MLAGHKKMFFLSIAVLLIPFMLFGQTDNYGKISYLKNNPKRKYPAVGPGSGFNIFYGDKGSAEKRPINIFFQLKADYQLTYEYSIEYNIERGSLSQEYEEPLQLFDFKLDYYNMNATMRYHLDEFFGISNTAVYSPYVALGIGLYHFRTYRNLMDNNNNPYYVNADGKITDHTGKLTQRDDIFESRIRDINSLTAVFPLGIGLKFDFSEHVEACTSLYVYYSGYDHLEGYLSYYKHGNTWKRNRTNKFNDIFYEFSVTLMYNFGYNSDKYAERYVPPVNQ